MPSHNPVRCEQPYQVQQLPQTKVCAACEAALAESVLVTDTDTIVCSTCRERFLSARTAREARFFYLNPINPQRSLTQATSVFQNTRPFEYVLYDHETALDTSSLSIYPQPDVTTSHLMYTKENASPYSESSQSSGILEGHSGRVPSTGYHLTTSMELLPAIGSQNLFTDITCKRVRPQLHHCLYPGAVFQGTQQSGRNSYSVTVTIVDVDFSSSFLCGYLRIRGLTDDWPELTTYFDAEIIGSRYGFLTQGWGASEQEDLLHWGRFPAFRRLRSELIHPFLKISDRDYGAVFMRWKERFLVPDHRIQDINGASFAGFYYICVDFNSELQQPSLSSRHSPPYHHSVSSNHKLPEVGLCSAKLEVATGSPSDPDSKSVNPPTLPLKYDSCLPVATMSGFYYHQNSEPYQQLTLYHNPERTCSSFEFR